MPIFTETLTTGESCEVYGGLTAANAYLAFAVSAASTAWAALAGTPDKQKACLGAATRMLDGLGWQGTPTGSVDTSPPVTTTLAWPRANVTDEFGNAVSSTAVPTGIVNGCFELAALIAANPTVQDQLDAGSNVASIGGGGAPEIRFFRPTSVQDGNAPVLPLVVLRLVGQYLASATAVVTGQSFGVSNDGDSDRDDTSAFDPRFGYTVTRA